MKVQLLQYDTSDHNGVPQVGSTWYGVEQIFQDSTRCIVLRDRFGGDHTLYDMNSQQGLHITKE
jgi:hypothetical protein